MLAVAGSWQRGVRILCALALFAIGLAHSPPVLALQIPAAEMAAFTLPDGSIPVLCNSLDHDGSRSTGHQKKHETNRICEVCRLVAGILIPVPADTTGVALRIATENPVAVTTVIFVRPVLVSSAAPRAPPATVLPI